MPCAICSTCQVCVCVCVCGVCGHGVRDAACYLQHLPVREAVDWRLVQVVKEVPVTVDDLLDKVEGAIFDTHTQELDDTRVSQSAHHLTLAHELGHLLLREPTLHLLDGARHAPLSAIHVGEGPASKERTQTELRKGYPASFYLLHSR